jgi:hypothetical protein
MRVKGVNSNDHYAGAAGDHQDVKEKENDEDDDARALIRTNDMSEIHVAFVRRGSRVTSKQASKRVR